MSIPGSAESGPFSGQPPVQLQQSIHLAKAVPIKKRRFPIIQLALPTVEEKSKDKQESNIPDGGLSISDGNKNTASLCNFDANKTLPFILRKEVIPTSIELGRGNVDIHAASKLLEAKPCDGYDLMGRLRDEMSKLLNDKSSEKGVGESCRSVAMKNVKQEVFVSEKVGACRAPVSTSSMNVELPLGPKEPLNPQKEDPSFLLRLGLTGENNDSSEARAGRLHWDLNTTMDAWEGSTSHDTSAQRNVELGKGSSCSSVVSCLTTPGMVILGLGKGKHILVDPRSSSSNSPMPPHCTADVSHDLGIATSFKKLDGNIKCSSLIDTSSTTDGSLHLKQVCPSAVDMNRAVKSEPVDENSNHDCSIGSCGCSTMGSSKFVSVKRELVNSITLETALPLSFDNRVVDQSIMSEMVVGNREASKSDNAILTPTVARAMQHPESCVSSSAVVVPSMHQGSGTPRLPTCSELTAGGNLSSQCQPSFHSKEYHNNENHDIRRDDKNGNLHKVGNCNLADCGKSKVAQVDEHAFEAHQSGEIAADDDEKVDVSTEEDSFRPNCGSKESCVIETPKIMGENVSGKEDGDYKDGEVQEHLQRLAGKDLIVEGKKTQNFELDQHDRNIYGSDFQEKVTARKNHDEALPNSEDSTLQKKSGEALQVTVNEKRSALRVEDVAKNDSIADNEQVSEATNKFGKEIYSGENDLTLSKDKASLNDHGATKDSGNKNRIINLSHTIVAKPPGKTRYITNRLLASQSGKKRYSNLDGEIQPEVNRDDTYVGGSNKFAKDRVQDQLQRNPRPSFLLGKGRISCRFGSLHGDWDLDHNSVPEAYNCHSDYHAGRGRHASNISDAELECNGHDIPQDSAALVNRRRKMIKDEFPTPYGNSRRLLMGDGDSIVTRSIPMLHRVGRNMKPNRCPAEDGSDFIGIHHGDNLMRHSSNDIIEYDNLDSPLPRGNPNFPTVKVHCSKSPIRSQTRLPGPWRSPTFYPAGRMRSPGHSYFCNEIVPRRRESPSYIAWHPNGLQGVDSGWEHVHPRPDRRSSPSWGFPRIPSRAQTLDYQEMTDGEEYMDGRRMFVDRQGPRPPRSFYPNYRSENERFHFDQNNSPGPYRFCPDMDAEFNVSEREIDGRRLKHQHGMVGRKRVRNIEEQVEQVWQDDGFSDVSRVRRRRY